MYILFVCVHIYKKENTDTMVDNLSTGAYLLYICSTYYIGTLYSHCTALLFTNTCSVHVKLTSKSSLEVFNTQLVLSCSHN